MNPPVQIRHVDGVAVVSIVNPPVNSLSADVRAALLDALQGADRDPAVQALVITGAAPGFCGGAEVREFNTPRQHRSPTLPELNAAQDRFGKPLVAALAGFAFGGGLELALACHWRVALPGTKLGLPEVRLGLMPGSGATQRLPRLVPMPVALQMITSGEPVDVATACEQGLVDRIVPDDLLAGAVAFAKRLAADGGGVRCVRDLPVRAGDGVAQLFEQTRGRLVRTVRERPGAMPALGCCEAALSLPFDEACAHERAQFLALLERPESRALRHVFFAERQAARIPDLPADTRARPLHEAAVIGAGTMGCGIAMSLADAGFPVLLADRQQAALERGLDTIRRHYEGSVAKGRLSAAERDRRLTRIMPASGIEAAAAAADLVIEAVFERMDVKQALFRTLDAVARPGAVLASNTSTLDIDAIAAVTRRPQDVVGLHFFSPAHVMRLLEIVRGAKTAPDVLATAMQLGRRLGKVAVLSGMCDGFIGNRMLQKVVQQSLFLLDEGCSPQQVDLAMTDWGMAMGPFAVGDLAGLDIGWEIRKRRRAEGSTMAYSAIADRLCEAGRLGQKTGAGWYRYEPGSRQPLPDPEVERLLQAHRAETGVTPREITPQEIVERLTWALANGGAALLDEGIALRASDIDMVYVTGYGFPAFRGGPMFHANAAGAAAVVAAIERFAAGYRGDQWSLAPGLRRLAAEDRRFNA